MNIPSPGPCYLYWEYSISESLGPNEHRNNTPVNFVEVLQGGWGPCEEGCDGDCYLALQA